jgi:hypothetical protein
MGGGYEMDGGWEEEEDGVGYEEDRRTGGG